MPELPDITVYVESLARHFLGSRLTALHLPSPFVVRTYDPPASALVGRTLERVERLDKRVVMCFEGELFAVIHLMVAGRLRLHASKKKLASKRALAALDFGTRSLHLTEASSKKRASIHVLCGKAAVAQMWRGGVEPMECTSDELQAALQRENRTLKRALTDQRLISGIGNAYSDEILHRARMSPAKRTKSLTEDEVVRLHHAIYDVVVEWTDRLRERVADGFPDKVTAFHEEMAVHGRYGLGCPRCGASVQRIRYAANESNYCPPCQTNGKLLADRSLSRLLKGDWPRSLEELEERTAVRTMP